MHFLLDARERASMINAVKAWIPRAVTSSLCLTKKNLGVHSPSAYFLNQVSGPLDIALSINIAPSPSVASLSLSL
jgi:hypothetical protein